MLAALHLDRQMREAEVGEALAIVARLARA
jgi:hypothetical protein